MITKANELAKIIKSRRKELKLSQFVLTHKLGYNAKTSQYVSNIELGKCGLPPEKINALSIALQIPRSKIIEAMMKDYEMNLLLVANQPATEF
jgi:transcriptional regulator with XRE-family HTH domain